MATDSNSAPKNPSTGEGTSAGRNPTRSILMSANGDIRFATFKQQMVRYEAKMFQDSCQKNVSPINVPINVTNQATFRN